MTSFCPLCASPDSETFMDLPPLCYRCPRCDLIFKDASAHLSPEEEMARYGLHCNDDTPAYRAFLAQTFEPLLPLITPSLKGLDFGCGPNPLMERLLRDRGFQVTSYDPYFLDNAAVLTSTYDFILCSEVVEHFYRPREGFQLLHSLLQDGGYLSVRTAAPPPDFRHWHYHRDPTHVAFYSVRTMEWIAHHFHWRLLHCQRDVSVFRKVLKNS